MYTEKIAFSQKVNYVAFFLHIFCTKKHDPYAWNPPAPPKPLHHDLHHHHHLDSRICQQRKYQAHKEITVI